MATLRLTADCFRCGKNFEQKEMRKVPSLTDNKRFECFSCFRNYKYAVKMSRARKLTLYCERCKFKFSSRGRTCLYCNKSDSVVRGNITASDLL